MAEKEKLSSTQVFEEEWDKKKIAIGIAILILLIAAFFGVRNYLLPMLGFKEFPIPKVAMEKVKGIETSIPADQSSSVSLPNAVDVQKKISEMQNQVSHLSLQDVANSSPQVKAILQQIQELPKTPANMAKQACINLCNRL